MQRDVESEPVCIEDEIPFEIPKSWEWVRLGDTGVWKLSGATPSEGDPDTSWADIDRSQRVYVKDAT